jgi:hypothetical protein
MYRIKELFLEEKKINVVGLSPFIEVRAKPTRYKRLQLSSHF